jgi:uncharacterized protein (DUF433 family)
MREMIEHYVDPAPGGFGIARARLRDSGTSVAAIIADLDAEDGDFQQVAQDFSTMIEAILAAVYFYWQRKDVIDAEVTVRRSGFTG